MTKRKLTEKHIKTIQKQLKEGYKAKDLAEKYGVYISIIYRRAKYEYHARGIPVETKNKIIKAIDEGYTKAEAAQLYGLNIGTVYNITRELGINGDRSQGNHIIRKNGIKLLNRLMTDGYLITDFNVPVVRNLQQKFPVIRSARYKDKTFFYLPGREDETVEAFFREKPDRVISYSAIEELSYLLGVKISKPNQKKPP
jgi:transposase